MPHWSPLVMLLLLAGVTLVAGWILIRRGERRQTKPTVIDCPVHGETFDATVIEDETGRVLHVVGCGAWHDHEKAGCGAPCLGRLRASAPRTTA